MRRIVAVIMVFLSILMISSSINVSSYNAKDRTFTVNIQYDSNLAVISPLYEEDYKKHNTWMQRYPAIVSTP